LVQFAYYTLVDDFGYFNFFAEARRQPDGSFHARLIQVGNFRHPAGSRLAISG
jgi:hypothetical protein